MSWSDVDDEEEEEEEEEEGAEAAAAAEAPLVLCSCAPVVSVIEGAAKKDANIKASPRRLLTVSGPSTSIELDDAGPAAGLSPFAGAR